MSRRSPLGRVLGLGSAKDGTSHWWSQRVSAVALVGLGLWFVLSLVVLAGRGGLAFAPINEWVAVPQNGILLIALLATLAYHSMLGVQVVVEDYVQGEWLKVSTLIALRFAHGLLAVAGIYAVLRIGFGGPG